MCTPGTHTKLSQELVSKALTREEVGLADALLDRVRRLAEAASLARVKLMLDAEHTYFQPVGGGGTAHTDPSSQQGNKAGIPAPHDTSPEMQSSPLPHPAASGNRPHHARAEP